MIEKVYRVTIFYEERNLFYKAVKKLEEMKDAVFLNSVYANDDVSEFSGCPAAGPYITGLFTSEKLAKKFHKEIVSVLKKFRLRIIE